MNRNKNMNNKVDENDLMIKLRDPTQFRPEEYL